MLRVPVLSPLGKPLMPTKASRARRWLKEGKAKVVHNDLGIFQIKLVLHPKFQNTQPIAVGIDPGKHYTGVGVQSAKFTLWLAHLQLPFKTVKDRMSQRRMMRRGRRGRRINRKIAFSKRAHRQKRFDNRRQRKVPPSIRANRELELRVLDELSLIYPITTVAYEIVKARGDKAFSPVMVGQNWQLENLETYCPVRQVEGWQTANIRRELGLHKQQHSKGDAIPATHAVDGVALACSIFIRYGITSTQSMRWKGEVQITPAPFAVIRRPPTSRRQLHLMVPAKGGVRRKYGGTVTQHGFRKGDYVEATQGNKTYRGWVSGDTEKQVSVSDASWKRLGQFTAKKVRLVQRSTGLIVLPTKDFVKLNPIEGSSLTDYPSPTCFAEVGVSPGNKMNWFFLSATEWKRMTQFLSVLCLCLFLVAGCGDHQKTSTSASGNGRITVGTTLKPRTLDPADAYELASLSLVHNMSDRLYTYDPGSTEIRPQLATDFPKVSQDGLTYTIPLRQGVVFHDGTPFNAEAMALTMRRFIENKGKPAFLLGDVVESAKATSEYELTIKLKKPFAAFPSLLAFAGVCPVSPKAYEIGEGKFHPNYFIGTGPYKLAKFSPDSLQLDVFDQYWGEKPLNKGVNVQILSSGVNLYNAFRKKAVDIAGLSMDPDQIRSLVETAKKGAWQAIPNQGNVVSYLTINRNQKPVDNPAVRSAIAAMINRPIMYERVLYGQAEALYSLIPKAFSDYQPVFQEQYGDGNIQKAKEMLIKAGFSKDNPAKVELWYPSGSPTRSLAAIVLKALAKKTMDGILQFEVNTVESTTAFKNIAKGLYPTFLLDWYPDFLDADNYIQPFLSCEKGSPEKGCENGGSQSQGSFYYNPQMNQLIDKQRQEQNPEARKQIFAEIQSILARDIPYIPLWQSKDYAFAQKGMSGVELDPTQILIYKKIKK